MAIRTICDTCENIPFHRLPSEEDHGYPHKIINPDLIKSASTCRLCNLILDAVHDLEMNITWEETKEIQGGPVQASINTAIQAAQASNSDCPITVWTPTSL